MWVVGSSLQPTQGVQSSSSSTAAAPAGEGGRAGEKASAAAKKPPSGSGGTMDSASSTASFGSYWDRARKIVAEKTREVYDPVSQSEHDTTESDDVEKGEAKSEWGLWAKAAAGRFHKQVTEAAEDARQGIAQVAEKAKLADLGEQAKGWQSEVARGLGRVADGATQAGTVFSEKGKVAQQLAKDLQGKSAAGLSAAKAIGAKGAQQAKDKAAAAAAGAKDKLSQAGQSISGLAALSLSPAKLAQFGGVFLLGIFLITTSFSFLPMLVISPQKFALLFAFGSMTLLSSFAILKGPKAFASSLVQWDKLPFSVAYVVGLVGTLVATIIMKSYILTAVFGIIQFISLLYFLASYVPGGKALLNFCGKCSARCARTVCRRMT